MYGVVNIVQYSAHAHPEPACSTMIHRSICARSGASSLMRTTGACPKRGRLVGLQSPFSWARRKRPENGLFLRFASIGPSRIPFRGLTSGANASMASNHHPPMHKSAKDLFQSLMSGVLAIRQKIEALPKQSPLWSIQVRTDDDGSREDIFQQVLLLEKQFLQYCEDGRLHPAGKHRHEATRFLMHLFELFSASRSSSQSVLDELKAVMNLMKGWKIDLQLQHCEFAMITAGNENRWDEAASIFSTYTDPRESGVTPATPDSNAVLVGLYCIAKASQESGLPVVEHVFDGVLQLSMISENQTDYIMAAGTAIGHVGEWKRFVQYLDTSYNAGQLGQALVAAVMKACVLCNRGDEAIDLYDDLTNGSIFAEEWQWGGGEDMLNPVCTDVALQALGLSSRSGSGSRALELFDRVSQTESECCLSDDALLGVVLALERENNWEASVSFFFRQLKHMLNPAKMAMLLVPVQRVCNSNSQPGVALLCQQLLTAEMSLQSSGPVFPSTPQVIDPSQIPARDIDNLLTSTMTSFCGVGAFQSALSLFDSVSDRCIGLELPLSRAFYQWVKSEQNVIKSTKTTKSWTSALKELSRIAKAASMMRRSTSEEIDPDSTDLFQSVVASFLLTTEQLSQPEMGVQLGRWIESSGSVTSKGQGLFTDRKLFADPTDSYLAASITVLSESNRHDEALNLAEIYLVDDKTKWPQACERVVDLLFSRSLSEEAVSLFREVLASWKNPTLFLRVARGLAERGEWKGVLDLYRLAVTSGCLTEELCFLALDSIKFTTGLDTRMRTMHSIIDEIATTVGTTNEGWVRRNYWTLKRLVGEKGTQRLLSWFDQREGRQGELQLALAEYRTHLSMGLAPSADVLMSIVAAACQSAYIPRRVSEQHAVPTSSGEWTIILEQVVQQAEKSRLLTNRSFVEDLALAWLQHGQNDAAKETLVKAMVAGVQVSADALAVLHDEESNGHHLSTADIEFLTR